MKKYIFILFFSFSLTNCNNLFSQVIQKNKIELTSLLGIKNIGNYRTGPIIGIQLAFDSTKWNLSYRQNIFTGGLFVEEKEPTIRGFTSIHSLDLSYQFKKCNLGIGYFSSRDKSINALLGIDFRAKGFAPFIQFPVGNLLLEGRLEIYTTPRIRVLDEDVYSFAAIYHFNKTNKNKLHSFKNLKVNLLGSARVFEITYPNKSFNIFDAYGTAIGTGIEGVFKKVGVSLEKDWWVSIIPDNFNINFANGYICNTTYNAKYFHTVENNKVISISVGYTLITDGATLIKDINNGSSLRNRKGIASSIAYSLTPNINIELRNIFVTKGEKLFNHSRLSLGLVYKYQVNQ